MKNEEYANFFNVCPIFSLNQGIHIGMKEHNRHTEFDKVLLAKHKLMVKQNISGVNPYKWSEFDKCFTQRDNLQNWQYIQERNLTNVVNVTNALPTY